jgi:peptidoglycan/xylan/chitin deacetylase (PgdA/CDA1 family)
MFYLVKTPGWLKRIYRDCIWQIPTKEKIIYLTFDDGPHPVATSFVLEQLKAYNASATFFCIGKNVVEYPEVYQQVINDHHAVGNHTYHHLNGWKTKDDKYMEDIEMAKKYIDSNLFRPPYGKITKFQLKLLAKEKFKLTAVLWTVLSGDFDQSISKERCLQNVIGNTGNGSIVVFHDSEKAYEKLQFTLPRILQYFSDKGYQFEKIKV